MSEPLIDPDCRDPHKHATCAGGPCQCPCHMSDDTGDRLIIAADIVARHRPILFSATHQVYVCGACSNGHSRVMWPCALRAEVGTLIDDPSNRLLPPHQETS